MKSITELGPVRVAEFKKAIRSSKREAKVARTLMLDLLALAYDSEVLIHHIYYARATEVLDTANTRIIADGLYKAIMKKQGLV